MNGMEMALTREEGKTIVQTSDADDGWMILPASPKFIRKFTKLSYWKKSAESNPDGYRDFGAPRNLVSFR